MDDTIKTFDSKLTTEVKNLTDFNRSEYLPQSDFSKFQIANNESIDNTVDNLRSELVSQLNKHAKDLESKMFTLLTDSITVAKSEQINNASERYNEFQAKSVKDMKNDIDIFRKEVDLMKDLVYGYEKETKDVTNLMKFQLSDVGKQMSHMKTSYKDLNSELLASM